MTASTIKTLSAQLATKEVSTEELARHYLSRIEAKAYLNTFIHVGTEVTLTQTQAADTRIAANDAAPLTGVPIVHKNVFVTRGQRAATGSKMFGDYVNPFDVTMVEHLGAAGMMVLSKTNIDEFAMGSSNENSTFGVVKNSWNLEHVPDDSPGSSAAVVAADLAPTATGMDAGDSIRQPTSFLGVTRIKPTYDRMSRYGMIAFVPSLDQGGPMTCTAEDCASLLSVMADFDPRDSASLEPDRGGDVGGFGRPLGQPLQDADAAHPLAGLRIGLPKEYFGEGLADDVRTTIRAALTELERLGATLVDISLPEIELSIPAYYMIAPTGVSSNLSRFGGIRYGHHATEYRSLTDMYRGSRTEGFGWEVKRRILVGTYALSHSYCDACHLQTWKIHRIIAQDLQNVLTGANRQCGVIMGPVTPIVTWKLGEKTSDPMQVYLADIFTLSISLAGLPGMSVPAGFGASDLPVGLQVIDNYFEEAHMLQIAHAFQQATD